MGASRVWAIGRGICILAALVHGALPAIIDTMDPHHLMNPAWPPHARQHLLWQILTGLFLSFVSIYLYVTATPKTFERVRFGVWIDASHILAFFVAALFQSVAGSAFDADGRALFGVLPPAILHFFTAGALLTAGYSLCRSAAQTTPAS